MPLSDALSQLVPDQVAALPDEQKSLFNNPGYRTIVFSPISVEETSRYYVPLYFIVDSEYTDEVKVHLANLGLATDYYAVDLTVSAQPPEGVIPGYKGTTDTDRPAAKIVMEGNTPEGTRKSWTFLYKMALCVFSNGNAGEMAVMWNVGEDRQADDDEYFMMSALGYLNGLVHPLTLAADSPSPG